jgi:hypothetical protein
MFKETVHRSLFLYIIIVETQHCCVFAIYEIICTEQACLFRTSTFQRFNGFILL